MNTLFRFVLAVLCTAASAAEQQPSGANAIVFAAEEYQIPPLSLAVAPGQVVVLHVHGVTADLSSPIQGVPGPSGLPATLGGISVDLIQGQAGTVTSLA